jgi:hypothetical protein
MHIEMKTSTATLRETTEASTSMTFLLVGASKTNYIFTCGKISQVLGTQTRCIGILEPTAYITIGNSSKKMSIAYL